MSAFIVSDKHINYLLTYASNEGISVWVCDPQMSGGGYLLRFDDVAELQAAAEVMLAENHRGVNARYNEHETPHEIKFKFIRSVSFNAVQVIKACQCLGYQCNETEEYQTSATHAILNHIEQHAISKLPGYDAAQWEIK